MHRVLRTLGIVTGCITLTLLAGCGGSSGGKYAVSGTVTLKKVPLDQGYIFFDPAAKEQGNPSGGPITNGSYSIPAEKGLLPGTYTVRITSGKAGAASKDPLPGESGVEAPDRIPEKYNEKSILKAEVKADGSNKFDFPIP